MFIIYCIVPSYASRRQAALIESDPPVLILDEMLSTAANSPINGGGIGNGMGGFADDLWENSPANHVNMNGETGPGAPGADGGGGGGGQGAAQGANRNNSLQTDAIIQFGDSGRAAP